MPEQAFKVNELDINSLQLRDDSGALTINGDAIAMASDLELSDYSSLTLSGTGSFDGAYTRNANQFSLDTDTAFSGNALFNANSGYYYFIKDGDNTTAVIYSEADSSWAAVQKSAFDFSTVADNDPLGVINSVSTFGNNSSQYENGVNQPTASSTFVYAGGTSPIAQALNNKENLITAGTTTQYWRGDKTFQELNAAAVGLGNVDNTADADKPVSTAQQTALDAKASNATLASNNNGDGASLIGIEDPNSRYTATNVEGALDEVKALADQNSLGLGAFWGEIETAEEASNVDINNPTDTIGGHTMTANDRVLLSAQTTASENGIYVWTDAVTAMTRATDADASEDFVTNKTVFIKDGTCTGCTFAYTGTNSPTVGTDDITFVLKSSSPLGDGSVTTAKIADGAITKAKLDQALQNEIAQVVTNAAAGASQFTLDSVLVDDVDYCEWAIVAVDGTTRQSIKVSAQHNGDSSNDATSADFATYASIGALAGFTINVDVDGTGSVQTMRLLCTTTSDAAWTARRVQL